MKKSITNVLYGKNITEKQVSDTLKQLGFSMSCKGYYYIKYALMLAINESDDYLFNVTKMLYPKLAKNFNTTATRVERSIRYSIDMAFMNMSMSDINEIFSNSYSRDKGKPTNSQFLITVAEYIKYNY